MLYENIDLWHFTVWQVYAARTICWKPTSDIRWACCWPKQICVWSSFCSWQCWHSTSLSLMFEFEEVEHIIQHIELSNKLWQHKYKCTCMRYVQNMEETTEDCFFTIPNDPTLDDYHIPRVAVVIYNHPILDAFYHRCVNYHLLLDVSCHQFFDELFMSDQETSKIGVV